MGCAGHVAHMGKKRGAHRLLAGKPEEKRPFGRPRHRWEDNIKTDLKDISWEGMGWVDLSQDRDQ